MSASCWKILDAAENLSLDELRVDASQVTHAPPGFSIVKRRRRGGLSEGVDEIVVNNGRLAFSVLPTRGMGLWKAWWNETLELGWQSPVRGPVFRI